MGNKKAGKNYRKLYKEHYGIEFGEDMAVHHIDFDRSNNNIDNLLLMPRTLHQKYHFHISQLGGAGNGIIDGDMTIDGNIYKIMALQGLVNALDDISKWVQIKRQMDYFHRDREA